MMSQKKLINLGNDGICWDIMKEQHLKAHLQAKNSKIWRWGASSLRDTSPCFAPVTP